MSDRGSFQVESPWRTFAELRHEAGIERVRARIIEETLAELRAESERERVGQLTLVHVPTVGPGSRWLRK